jgi:hypothetical protein
MLSYYLDYFDVSSNNGSVGKSLHCEPQGDKLVKLLVTPANFRHHAQRKDVRKAIPNTNVYIAKENVDYVVKQLLTAKQQTERTDIASGYPACGQDVLCNLNVPPFPSAYSLAQERVHVHMHETILNASARPAFLPAMLLLVA